MGRWSRPYGPVLDVAADSTRCTSANGCFSASSATTTTTTPTTTITTTASTPSACDEQEYAAPLVSCCPVQGGSSQGSAPAPRITSPEPGCRSTASNNHNDNDNKNNNNNKVNSNNSNNNCEVTDEVAGTVSHRYIWKDREMVSVFPADGRADVAGALPSAPSGPLKEYEDKLKAIDLCSRGVEKAEIARLLGRSEHWVKRWWRQCPHHIAKPAVAHGVLVQHAPLLSFRDLELRRGFIEADASSAGALLLHDVIEHLQWEPARRATRDPLTGDLKVRFDMQGRSIEQPGRFVAEYRGGLNRLDAVLQKAASVANIRDPGARVFLNRYEGGCATCPTHRHDFWTCMLSLGVERVAIVEDRPFLLRPGDLLVFGTQSHGLPAMPDLSGCRVSVLVFFSPDADGIERRWATMHGSCNTEDAASDDHDECTEVRGGSRAHCGEAVVSAVAASAGGRLVDSDLLGCPGISLGLVARRSLCISTPAEVITVGCGFLPAGVFFGMLERESSGTSAEPLAAARSIGSPATSSGALVPRA
ncbi:unnamed protein product [Polarella glacialis]|uniref:Uncharacterized protein n=1 Tax=Polarella glacialis TaxID=89957 RepID=A0A813IYB8_POLGL|nr:unnamed protein product [Polarella glacialis]CAE8661621.1 unnamed protein product [Polarella glacialis]